MKTIFIRRYFLDQSIFSSYMAKVRKFRFTICLKNGDFCIKLSIKIIEEHFYNISYVMTRLPTPTLIAFLTKYIYQYITLLQRTM